jgi:anti-sigma regulatory factor (Ser/Thr protein kinase)
VPPEIHTSISSDSTHLAQLIQQVAEFLQQHQVPAKASYTVQLVLEEVVTNIINYAYEDAPGDEIDVRVALETGHAVVQTEDSGPPFDLSHAPRADTDKPLKDRPIGGLGIHLVRQMAERVDYARVDDRNCVRIQIALDDCAERRE